MKSPFPGMDPFIEGSGLWGDFHQHLIEAIYIQLADTAPEGFFVRTAMRSYVEMVEQEGKRMHPFLPDVGLHGRQKPGRPPRSGRSAVAEPADVKAPVEMRAFIAAEQREKFVEIYEGAADPRLVTAIEVLSPANKAAGSAGRDVYLRKRQGLMLGYVNLVEIDLLRGGERMPMLDPWPDSPYVLMLARRGRDHYCQVWRGHCDGPLPTLPVPLVQDVPDLSIDLQTMVDTVYRRGRYRQAIDYTRRLSPPLSDAEKALLPAPAKRRRK